MNGSEEHLEIGAQCLLVALAARNLETGGHAQRVCDLALELGRALQLPATKLFNLKFGALLHDVGKLATPDAILCKPGPLTDDEWKVMREHPITGANLLRSLKFPLGVSAIVEQHHERHDGLGYPYGLRGREITIEARVFSVVDAYDAITADRCYHRGAAPAVAYHELASWAGKQFDPDVVDAFLDLRGASQYGRVAAAA